jgi:DNA-binding CsgD family transcriptional regulator
MTNIDTAVRRMFHMGKPIESIAQTHKISIKRVRKIITNSSSINKQTPMKKSTTHPSYLRTPNFNADVKRHLKRGLTSSEVAAVMGCSYSTINRAMRDMDTKKTPMKKTTKVASKPMKTATPVSKSNDGHTSSFSFLWGAISFSKTKSVND